VRENITTGEGPAAPNAPGVKVHPYVGLGGGGVEGRF
jgi:hypothetical protein